MTDNKVVDISSAVVPEEDSVIELERMATLLGTIDSELMELKRKPDRDHKRKCRTRLARLRREIDLRGAALDQIFIPENGDK